MADEAKLDALVKSIQDKTWSPSEDELAVLVDAFLPTHSSGLRSKAYIALSATSQRLRDAHPSTKAAPDASTDAVVRPFAPLISAKLSDTAESAVLAGVCFLTALFQVDWGAASAILQRDGVLDCIMDSVDLFQSSTSHALAVAQLIAQAAGHKACRALIPGEGVQWLEMKARHSKDTAVRAAAAVALVKLSQGAGADAAGTPVAERPPAPSVDQDLVKMMKGLVVSGDKSSSLADSVEGLAYMSVDPAVKEQLSKDTQFLKQLFSLVPKRKGAAIEEIGPSPVYGVAVIIMNLCIYRPQLTEEEAQIAKLRRMASTSNKKSDPDLNPLEDDAHAKERGRRLMQAGVLETLTVAVKASDSRATRLAVGKAILSLVEDQESRGKILQAGCAKALVTIIQGLLPPTSSSKDEQLPPLDRADLDCMQALAKLAITSSPVQVFGPNEGAHYDAIRPFTILLVHPSSTLLQRFEAIMALTNLASQSPEVASRIASAPGLMNKVELLMLEDHNLVRRAATELVCNLIAGSEDIFEKYGGKQSSSSKSKLHVLLALCDVDDLATRLAASGAIAMLTASPDPCQLLLELERENHRALPILGQLIDSSIHVPRDDDGDDEEESAITATPDPGQVHRGVACVRNLLAGVDEPARKELGERAQEIGLVQALVQVFRAGSSNPSNPVLRPAAEAIKLLLDSGITP